MPDRPQNRNLTPFDSARGRAAASEPRLPEPTVKVQVVLFERQQQALADWGGNRSELIRQLLDEWLEQRATP